MASIAEKYWRRSQQFANIVSQVSEQQWENPSPCVEWNAGEVFAHVIDMHSIMLRPLGRESEIAFSSDVDPLEQYRRASDLISAVLADPASSKIESDIPGEGGGPLELEIDTILSQDVVVHSWDLAVAVGLDSTMHPDDVTELWERFAAYPAEVVEQFRTPNAFGPGVTVLGPEVEVSPKSSPQDRLLGLYGRDPQWGKC